MLGFFPVFLAKLLYVAEQLLEQNFGLLVSKPQDKHVMLYYTTIQVFVPKMGFEPTFSSITVYGLEDRTVTSG